jgi:hypothetical protein
MRREIHLVDGSVLVQEGFNSEGAESPVQPAHSAGGDKKLDPIQSKLRSLRTKARRLGVWNSVLGDTERGIVNASLLLSRLGRRIRIILEELALKLKQELREAVLKGFREAGLNAAAPLVSFFRNTPLCLALTCDSNYLFYLGFRERVSRFLRAQPI